MRSLWRIRIPVPVRAGLPGLRGLQTQASFPCIDKVEQRTQSLRRAPEKHVNAYAPRASGYEVYRVPGPVALDFGKQLKDVELAYETWGELNASKTNAILLHTGLSASSHARSHAKNTKPGWWEKFIGPGLALDTNKFFVICTNVLGGCYGSTGPSSWVPGTNERYATNFPVVTIQDMVRLQADLVRDLGIEKLHASMGSSMGAMQCLAFATEFPDRVGRVLSISGCARSHPSSIASRFVQRQVLMHDPHWNRGFYYDGVPPHQGMKLAREIGTITYRSGPEWEQRFATERIDNDAVPSLCPDYLIETYLDYQGEKFCMQYDPNSLLYVSKAMDIFDLSASNTRRRHELRDRVRRGDPTVKSDALYKPAMNERPKKLVIPNNIGDLVDGVRPMAHLPTFVLGVESDALFPAWQQREIHAILKQANPANENLVYHELGLEKSLYGHDTFLVDPLNVGTPIKEFLERDFS